MTAIEKYNQRARAIDSLVCVGLDSDFSKLPQQFKDTEFPQFEFNKWIIDETHEFAAAFKMNSAFYEARGDQGIKELKMTYEYLNKNHPEIFTILDAKRADIGNTNNGYAEFTFNWLESDAITLHPYLGKEALMPFLDRKDKVSIILVRTSNPGAPEFQDLIIEGTMMKNWEYIATKIKNDWNANENVMVVIGATYPDELQKAREIIGDSTMLVPGVGAQGGEVKDVISRGLNVQGLGLIINSSRGIIFSNDPKTEAKKLRDEIQEARKEGIKQIKN